MTKGPDHIIIAEDPWFSIIERKIVELWQTIIKLKPGKTGNVKSKTEVKLKIRNSKTKEKNTNMKSMKNWMKKKNKTKNTQEYAY